MQYGICTTYHTDKDTTIITIESFALVYPMYRDSIKMCKKMFSQKGSRACVDQVQTKSLAHLHYHKSN